MSRRLTLALGLLITSGIRLPASDPPHKAGTGNIQCVSCHKLHNASGGTLTAVSGNTNLCLSCHVSGGLAANKAYVASDQAVAPGGLPSGITPGGTSHRWDSGPQGRVSFKGGAATASTGSIRTTGAYSGAYPTTLEIKITTAGAVGTAKFQWMMTTNGGSTFGTATTNVATASTVALGTTGISLSFTNGVSGTSFALNDVWQVYARAEIRVPATAEMASRMEQGRMMCSTCHDQHLQADAPFDPSAPATYSAGVTTGRHNMRVANDSGQMCGDCHNARNVTATGGSSHPLVAIAPSATLKLPSSTLPLRTDGKVQCLTCHRVHNANTTDGNLLREPNASALCQECHTNALATATHMSTTSGVLWPGGQYGTTYPAIPDTTKRGACVNCHDPHGWPDASAPGSKYPKLLVENRANLCLTCHDGSPASTNIQTAFATDRWVTAGVGANNNLKLNCRHDIYPSDTTKSGASMGCGSCHNPHQVTATAKVTADPDPGDGIVPAAGKRVTGLDLKSEICLDCHDGSFPPSITPPTTALDDIATSYQTDAHGKGNGSPKLKTGTNYFAIGDVIPCMTCHEPHGSTNLFHLRTKVYGKDGVTQIPADARTGLTPLDPIQVTTLNNVLLTNGYYFCNTCHTSSMGSGKSNCFGCHYHSTRF